MRKPAVTRTFYKTEIQGVAVKINGDGQVETVRLEPVYVDGDISSNKHKMNLVFAKKYVDVEGTTMVTGCNVTSELRSMSIETFMENSEVVQKQEEV